MTRLDCTLIGRAVARIDAFDLACDQTVADMIDAGAAVAVDGRAEKTHRAHFVHDFAVEFFMAMGHQHARHQFVLAKRVRRIAHHALVVGQLIVRTAAGLPI